MATPAPAAAPATSQQHPGPPSPESIIQLASGFMTAQHLFAASELGLFEALAGSPAAIDTLAARTGLTRRAARISADAMVALGLLDRDGGIYRNSETAAAYLAGRTTSDLRPLLRFWGKISYPGWAGLAAALATGPTRQVADLDGVLQQAASAGIEAMMAGPAAALAATVDFSACRRLLDVGGGTGSWSIAVARRHPHMEATVFELPAVAGIARRRVAAAGLGSRIEVMEGDVMDGALPAGHDVCLLANLVHLWPPEENQVLLRHVRGAAGPGARLLLADLWTDPGHTQPLLAVLMAGVFAQISQGDVYSVDEARQWLEATGWRFLEHWALAGSVSLVEAETA